MTAASFASSLNGFNWQLALGSQLSTISTHTHVACMDYYRYTKKSPMPAFPIPPATANADLITGLAYSASLAPFARYNAAIQATKIIPKVIEGLIKNEELPFMRADSSELLQKYHYGIIDNDFNMVLVKHPNAKNSAELKGFAQFIKMFQWNQPFQRTRFLLQPPELREKEKPQTLHFAMNPA